MSKIIVIYDSQTGFTERMAKAVVKGAGGVGGVEVELLKVGTAFSVSKLNAADAIILGSPTVYGSVTPEMGVFLECVKAHVEAKRLKLSGKIGGAFASYEWDGGWVVEKIKADMTAIGIKVLAPMVSLADGMGGRHVARLTDDAQQQCQNLGRSIAKHVTS